MACTQPPAARPSGMSTLITRRLWSSRRAPLLTIAAAFLTSVIALGLMACSEQESFQGTELTAASPAADFEFQNQWGRPFRLSDHRGEVVLLTFLYTNCPDVCPIVASHLRETHEILDEDAEDVAFVAVSVDPQRDTVESARSFSDKWQMTDKWDFLVGARDRLSPIWTAYYLDPTATSPSDANLDYGDEQHGHGGVDALGREITSSYLVSHSAPVYLINQEGKMRVVFTLPFQPEDLAHDVRLLLK